MNIKYEAEKRNGYLLVRAEGTTNSPEDLLEYVDLLLKEVARRDISKVLLDNRTLLFERKNIGTFDTAVRCIDKLDQSRTIKVAMLARPERMEYAKVYETIGLTNGVEIKVFEQSAMAVAWLTI